MQRFSKKPILPVISVLLIALLVKAATAAMGYYIKQLPIAAEYALCDIALFLPFAIYRKTVRERYAENVDLQVFANPALLAVSTYFMSTLANLLLTFCGVHAEQNGVFWGDTSQTVTVAVHAVIIAPVIEEFVFRKVIYSAALPFGRSVAIVFSAMVFALFHPSAFIHSMLFGLLLAYVASGRRLLPAIIIHGAANLASSIPPLVEKAVDNAVYNVFSVIYLTVVFAFGIICTAICAAKFLRLKNGQKP